MELANKTRQQVSTEEIHYLTNEMRRVAGFLPSSEFLVMTKESIEVLIDPNKSLEDCIGVCEVETGRLLGANWILTGEVIRFGKSLRVSVKLHDTKSGQYLAGESLKGKQVEDLELPIQQSTLKLIYQISPTLEQQVISKVGPDITQQLECFKNISTCRSNTSSLSRNRRTNLSASLAKSAQKNPDIRADQTSSIHQRDSSKNTATAYESQSDFGVTVDAFGFLLFGPTIVLEVGQQSSFRFIGRMMTMGLVSHAALAPDEFDTLEAGTSFGVGYRMFSDKEHARRGMYWGIDLEYMMIETIYDNSDLEYAVTESEVLTGIFHFGYRWVTEDMIFGDLFGIGLWLAYAQPQSVKSTDDAYDDEDSRVYGGISLDLGWMF